MLIGLDEQPVASAETPAPDIPVYPAPSGETDSSAHGGIAVPTWLRFLTWKIAVIFVAALVLGGTVGFLTKKLVGSDLVSAAILTAECQGGAKPKIVLDWTTDPNAKFYKLHQIIDSGEAETIFEETKPNITTYTQNVMLDHQYSYWVQTQDAGGSNIVVVLTSQGRCSEQ